MIGIVTGRDKTTNKFKKERRMNVENYGWL